MTTIQSKPFCRELSPRITCLFRSENRYINDNLFRRRAWKTILEQCHIEYRKPYATRHTAISHALKSGANYIELAEATGHDAKVLHQSYASAIESKSIFVEF